MEMGGELKKVLKYWMEGEITSFIKVWLSAYLSLTYCYIAAKLLRSSGARLAAFLPVVCLFILLPLELHSVHLVGTTGFFLAWLATFKLLLLAFHRGPLSATPPLSLPRFLAVACLPIKLRQGNSYKKDTGRMHRSLLVKGALFVLLLKVYEHDDRIHPNLIKAIYSLHVYLCLELILAIAAAMARGGAGAAVQRALPVDVAAGFLGAAVEPHGNAYTAPHGVPPRAGVVCRGRGEGVGPAASCGVDLRCFGSYARAYILLLGPREAHVGDQFVFHAARVRFGGRACCEEGGRWQVALACAGGEGADRCIRVGDGSVAVFPAAGAV